jgi:anti-anti-sigma factor
VPNGIESEVVWIGTRVTLILEGELDQAVAGYLERLIDGLVLAGASEIEIDAGGISFMDSTGIRLMFQARRQVPIWVGAASPVVKRLCALLDVTDLLTVPSATN